MASPNSLAPSDGHVIEYAWELARALCGPSTAKPEKWERDRVLALLTARSAGELAKTIRWHARNKKLDAVARRDRRELPRS